MRVFRPLSLLALPLCLLATTGCRSDPGSDAAPPVLPAAVPTAVRSGQLSTAAPTATAAHVAHPVRPAASPPGAPATARPTGTPRAVTVRSLRTADWGQVALPAGCRSPRRGTVVYGDFGRDGGLEAALPATCTGPDGSWGAVGVYTGDGSRPRLMGNALPAAEHGRLQAVQARDGYLVVSAFGWSGPDRAGQPDLAVTTRWRTVGGRLDRTDRWVDPADVMDADQDQPATPAGD